MAACDHRQVPTIKVYVCNVMSQPGETDGYSVSDHIRAIQNHAHASLDYVIVNEGLAPKNVIRIMFKNSF